MQPQSPNPNFDFMLKDNKAKGRGLPMPNLPKPAKIALGVVGGLLLLIITSSLLSSRNSGKFQPIVNVLARDQEILRVTTLVQQQLQLQDPTTQAMAATAGGALSSEKVQLLNYLSQNHVKVSNLQLNADADKSTDSNLQTAAQNNGLDAAYASYLKTALATYQSDLQTAYKSAGPNGKNILSGAFDSATAMLKSPPLNS